MNPGMIRKVEKMTRAWEVLRAAVEQEDLSELERAGLLHCFEIAFEVVWKCALQYLNELGLEVMPAPRAVLRSIHLVLKSDDGEAWLEMLKDRNIIAHNYDEAKREELTERIRNRYAQLFASFVPKLSEKILNE